MEKYPRAIEFLGQNWQNSEQMEQLEEELKREAEMRKEEEMIRPKLEVMMIDAMLVKQGTVNLKEAADEKNKANTMIQDCMGQIMQMEQLLEDAGLQNILYYTIQRKEREAEQKMAVLADLADHEEEQNAILEDRDIVREMRVEQKGKIETDQMVANMDQELLNLDYEWTITIGDMNDNRNKKIVSIVQLSKQINEMHAMFKKMDLLHDDFSPEGDVAEKNTFDMKSTENEVSQLPVNPSTDSAVSFLNKLLFEKPTQDDNEVEETDDSKESEQDMTLTQEVETPLRSILVNREEGDPVFFSSLESKQVRFAASPELTQIREVEVYDQDWPSESGEPEELEEEVEESPDEEEEVSEEELEEEDDDELEEDSDDEFEEDSEDESEIQDEGFGEDAQVMEPKEYEEKIGSEMEESGSDDKGSGGEASGEEEPDVVAGQIGDGITPKQQKQPTTKADAPLDAFFNDNMVANPEKPKILSVEVIPSIRTLEDRDNIPSTSSGIRSRFTSRLFSTNTMELNKDEPLPPKRLKLEEDEFPMAQPQPDLFKSLSTNYEGNEDNQSLEFDSPTNDINDDYLLNFSDDNDVTLTRTSYIL
ncbi:glutamic acid-rich protein [Drosophila subpulchrella]|uniref:glutamic acid-rich protein n=1 Tax=Drosophila subpulchrella TaxID=1486046 RepID=UPI0018A12E4B|nr:glutamic acid-rich protein [Drosophila subpulchrella]